MHSAVPQQWDVEDIDFGAMESGDLVEDANLYQDAAIEYQNAYEPLWLQQEELQSKYAQQAHLIEEASGALKAAEAKASKHHQELVYIQKSCDADIQSAVNKAVAKYQAQLSSANSSLQSKDHAHQQAVQKLQDQMHVLELSLASQTNLPSVATTHSGAGLREEVFNIRPATVNPCCGTAVYNSQDQTFFQKQVRFEDNSSSPDLKPEAGPSKLSSSHHIPHHVPYSSTPHHGTILLNKTFDISQIQPLFGSHQDAVSIAAEVSAAAVTQASKEFCHMCKPKITKFRGGYSTDAKLVFCSWHVDVLSHIQDHELDNKAAIQLIKDRTQESACQEVEFQLVLCGEGILYQDLLKHLSIAFQGGDNDANLLANFIAMLKGQRNRKRLLWMSFSSWLTVISKKPDFQTNLDQYLNSSMLISYMTTIAHL